MTDEPKASRIADAPDLTVITATWRRPKMLALCLAQFRQQCITGVRVEHLVVSDGVDARAEAQAVAAGARYIQRSERGGQWGALAKDDAIRDARGRYVCFWDDDNHYEPHALATLWAAAWEFDIGVVQCWHFDKGSGRNVVLPRVWNGQFTQGDVDTMCVCVRREVALTEPWAGPKRRRGEDYRWLARLQQGGASLRFVPLVIGSHL